MAEAQSIKNPWGGGVSPFAVSWQKLMMWTFIVSDALLFGSMLSVYGFARLAQPAWPNQAEVFHLSLIGFMTFVLITSSATMATAVSASHQGKRSRVIGALVLTIVGGCTFLGLQVYEWATFIGEGARLHSNPWGAPAFSASFFAITGFHGSHVLTGVIILVITAIRTATGRVSEQGVELAGLYWHFVDLVWVFIFTLFYLI